MAWTLRKESLFSHQTSYPFAGAMNALCAQLCMNTWTAIDTAIGLESHFHLLCSLGILTKSRAFWYAGLVSAVVGVLIALTGVFDLFLGGH